MPLVTFAALPDASRVWVFGSATPLEPAAERALLDAVDLFLSRWAAHGTPLTNSREWRDHRFLAVAVDTTQAHASGCSIDGLFRELRRIDAEHGSAFIGGGRVFYRDAAGAIQAADRGDLDELAERGAITRASIVFDTTVATVADWRDRFETAAAHSWHGALLPATA